MKIRLVLGFVLTMIFSAKAQEGIIGARLNQVNIGVQVTGVVDGYPAQQSGIQTGDVITNVDNMPVGTTEYFVSFIRVNPGRRIKISYLRGFKSYYTYVTIAANGERQQSQQEKDLQWEQERLERNRKHQAIMDQFHP